MDTPPARPPETTPAVAPAPSTPDPSKPAAGPIARFRWQMERWAVEVIAEEAAGGEASTVESIEADIRAFAAELAGPDPTPIERTLAETAALAWFGLRFVEAHNFAAKGRTLNQADYDIRRLDAAHRRYLATLRTLAQVRKLALPAVVQVNVGGHVNAVATNGNAI